MILCLPGYSCNTKAPQSAEAASQTAVTPQLKIAEWS